MIYDILQQFNLQGRVIRTEPYGNGHINWTYRCFVESGDSYIVQRINTYVFNDPVGLMNNIEKLTDYLRDRAPEEEKQNILQLIKAKNGRFFTVTEEGQYWRTYRFIPDSVCYDAAPSLELFEECGRTFGNFQSTLADFPVDRLVETIPDFHNTVKRYEAFEQALDDAPYRIVRYAEEEIAFAHDRKPFASFLMDKIASKEIPLRVTHNDTKINNVLFHEKTNKGLSVIDLDTVMPGLPAVDFGDSIRYGANNGAEDEQDLSKVFLRMDNFEAFAKGFCGTSKERLAHEELEICAEAARLITLEIGLRFLTDYLMGNVYFKTAYPEHNLVRARSQFKLVADMEQKKKQMQDVIDRILE